MTQCQRDIKARWSNRAKMRMKKQNEKILLSDIGGGNILEVITGKAPKCYK